MKAHHKCCEVSFARDESIEAGHDIEAEVIDVEAEVTDVAEAAVMGAAEVQALIIYLSLTYMLACGKNVFTALLPQVFLHVTWPHVS